MRETLDRDELRKLFLFESLSLESLLFSALGRNSLCFDAFSF